MAAPTTFDRGSRRSRAHALEPPPRRLASHSLSRLRCGSDCQADCVTLSTSDQNTGWARRTSIASPVVCTYGRGTAVHDPTTTESRKLRELLRDGPVQRREPDEIEAGRQPCASIRPVPG